MKELILSPSMIVRLENVYQEMESAYDQTAKLLHFGCEGCSDNCCDSYFQHHTYIEWCYLWIGISKLQDDVQKTIMTRAQKYLLEVETAMSRNERPQTMCPLNNDGLCMVYTHRLMVCRTHGVPAVITRPDGQKLSFPGCFRCQERVGDNEKPPYVERTPMLRQLALLENELLQNNRHLYPRVKLTIAQMLIKGPPALPKPACQK